MWAILDITNFYVSAERLFDPALRKVPVCVLSNNDDCCVARSEEAKALHMARRVRLGNHRPALARQYAAATHSGRADRFAATVCDTVGSMASQNMGLRAIFREMDWRWVLIACGGVWQAV